MSLFDSASIVVTPNAYKASKLYAIKPTDGSGDLSVVRATTATRVNASGVIETVSANVPRLDYSNGSCPSILVEGQRTNLFSWSEDFSSASYNASLRNGSIVVNSINSPNGTLTADTYVENSTTNFRAIFQNVSVNSGTKYTLSVYAKNNGRFLQLTASSAVFGSNAFANFDLTDGTIGSIGSTATATIEDANNGWYRCSITMTATSTSASGNGLIVLSNSKTSGRLPSYLGDGTSGVHIWGAQLEAGSNATSYIPTTTASVTRNADVISKTGISSLIGQTEGTLFADVNVKNLGIPTRQIFNLTNGTPNFVNLAFLNTNVLRVTIRANGGTQYNVSTSALPIGRYKLAATYKAGELKLYVNGVLIGTNTNASVSWSSALDKLNLDNSVLGGENFSDKINSAALWKTALTEQECINLTSI